MQLLALPTFTTAHFGLFISQTGSAWAHSEPVTSNLVHVENLLFFPSAVNLVPQTNPVTYISLAIFLMIGVGISLYCKQRAKICYDFFCH